MNSSSPRAQFEAHLLAMNAILTQDDDYLFVLNGGTKVLYPAERLHALDPRIMPAIETLERKDRCRLLRASWAFWQEPVLPRFKASVGMHTETSIFALTQITEIKTIDHASQAAFCLIGGYCVETMIDGTEYAMSRIPAFNETIPFADLERMFPGALQKLDAAQTLDLSGAEMALYVMPPPAQPEPLPEPLPRGDLSVELGL